MCGGKKTRGQDHPPSRRSQQAREGRLQEAAEGHLFQPWHGQRDQEHKNRHHPTRTLNQHCQRGTAHGFGRFPSNNLTHQRRSRGHTHHHQPHREEIDERRGGWRHAKPDWAQVRWENPGDSRQQHDLQRQTQHQPQGVHFQLRHWIRGLDRSYQALTQKSQEASSRQTRRILRLVIDWWCSALPGWAYHQAERPCRTTTATAPIRMPSNTVMTILDEIVSETRGTLESALDRDAARGRSRWRCPVHPLVDPSSGRPGPLPRHRRVQAKIPLRGRNPPRDPPPKRWSRPTRLLGAAAISCLTNQTYFGGTLEDLKAVKASVEIPVLRKDFVVDRRQLLEARGAQEPTRSC